MANHADDLVRIGRTHGPEPTLKQQLVGAWRPSRLKYSLPQGEFEVSHGPAETVVRSATHVARLPLRDGRAGIPQLRRGVSGTLDGDLVTLVRPRYGFRRSDRGILIDAGAAAWRTEYLAWRRYGIVRRDNRSMILKRDAADLFVDRNAPEADAALALALDASGVISTSSLLCFLSLP